MRDLLRRLEAGLLDALDRWLIRHHAPIDLRPGILGCLVCRERHGRRRVPARWPCKPYVEAADRLRERA